MKPYAYYNEHDKNAAEWLRQLIKDGLIADGEVDERSIEDVLPNELAGFTQCHFFAGIGGWSLALRMSGWPDDKPVWTGSCPCQPFSAAGKGVGTDDERHLWPAFHHLISQCRPATLFGEQVEAAIRHGWLDLVQSDMEGIGYAFAAAGIPAGGVGAPHIRQRLWFVAHAQSKRATSSILGNTLDTRPQRYGRPIDQHDAPGWEGAQRHSAKTGFWDNCDWIPCRDGKYRPVESKFISLPNGLSGRMVYRSNQGLQPITEEKEGVTYGAESKVRTREDLPKLQINSSKETVSFGIRRHGGILPQEILQRKLYEQSDVKRKADECELFAKHIDKITERIVSGVREERTPSCSPHRRESIEQRINEFADFVRILPRSFAFAELYEDHATKNSMLALLKTDAAKRLLLNTSFKAKSPWESVSQEEKNEIWVGYWSRNFVKTIEPPTIQKGKARVMRLKGFGNAIVPQVAAEFIKATRL